MIMKQIRKTITTRHGDKHWRSACMAHDSIGNEWVFPGFGEPRDASEKDAEDKFRMDEKEWANIERAKIISHAPMFKSKML